MNRNILICSAGRRVSLVDYFKSEATERLGADTKVLTTDLEPSMAPACHASDEAFTVGKFTDPNYIDSLIEICDRHRVGMLIPTIDTELMLLATETHRFEQSGTKVIISSPTLVKTCRDKRKTNELFEKIGFQTPKPIDIKNPQFPLFAKPISGSSSNDIYLIKDENSLSNYICDTDKFVHQEYLSPESYDEYTVDLYYDRQSALKCAVPRLRIATRAGEIAKGITTKNEVFDFVLAKLRTLPGAVGCITLQVFLEKQSGNVIGIEFNARFGGGYPLSYLAGANFPGMLIDEHILGISIDYFDDWEENLLLLRYDHELVIHESQR